MRILFIFSRLFKKYKEDFYDYTSRIYSQGKVNCSAMPLALPTLAAITPDDIEIKLINENNTPSEVVDFDEKVDIVGISCVTLGAVRAYEIARRFREKGVYVVMGGVHVSSLPEEASLYADTIFIGEAEETWPKFIEDYKNNRPKAIYKCERYPDLQQLSIPRWDLVKSKYPVTYVQTTRGCPHRCEFCLVKSYLGRPRFKPLENVLKEIETVIGRTKSNLIDFADDNIFSNKKYSRALFEALIPLNVNWWGAASIDVAKDEEILTLARKSGCVSLGIGIESINQKSLDSVNKGRQNKTLKLKENIRKIQSHGISVLGLFMLGFDEDDPTIFQRTRDFIEEANLGICSFSILTPLPGTSIFDKLRKEGRLIHQNWDLYNYFNVNYEPKLMSREELREGFNRVVNSLYSYNHLFARLDREWQAIKGSYSNHENDREIAARVHMIKKYYVDMLLDEYDSLKSEATMRPYLKRVIHEIQNKDVSVIPVLSSGLTQTYQYSQMVEDNGKGQWQEVYHEN